MIFLWNIPSIMVNTYCRAVRLMSHAHITNTYGTAIFTRIQSLNYIRIPPNMEYYSGLSLSPAICLIHSSLGLH